MGKKDEHSKVGLEFLRVCALISYNYNFMSVTKEQLLQSIKDNVKLLELGLEKISDPVLFEELEKERKNILLIDEYFEGFLEEELEELYEIELELRNNYMDIIKLRLEIKTGSDNINAIFE